MEIQAGLAYTQNESLPFPPNTAWEWLEAYTPLAMNPEDVHCDYETARRNVENWLDEVMPEEKLNSLLESTKADALKSVPYTLKGHPWGTLDNEIKAALGAKSISPHLCFGELEEEQKVWQRFLRNGYLDEPDPKAAPASYMVQDEWFSLLKKTVRGADKFNWYAWYNLGICYYARDEYDVALGAFEKSLALKSSTWAYHGVACALFSLERFAEGAFAMAKALEMNVDNLLLAKEALRLCEAFGQHKVVLSMYNLLSDENKADPLIQGFYAMALAYTGSLEEAKAILEKDGGLIMNDLREGDDSITSAYIYIVQEMAKREGKQIDAEDVDVPKVLDFRMFHTDKK